HIAWQDLATYWTNRFLDDMQKLNWIKPTHYLKASEQIPHMITVIEKIVKNNSGYVTNGSVYLDTKLFPHFGKLSGFSEEQMLNTAKKFEEDLTNPDKKHPLDITLWRASSENQAEHIPSFTSPWGQGRPGWHIECSAMAMNSLGEQIDIHGGGIDLIYPHHESEIAQSESATKKEPFAKYWLHTGTVYKDGEKMSKSLGNLVMIAELLKIYSPDAIRWMLLSHHYRSQWEYNEKELQDAQEIIALLKKILPEESAKPAKNSVLLQTLQEFMDNDMETDKALAFCVATAKKAKQAELFVIKDFLHMLGFTLA
ncbi:MAG: class I tRNA ligase family protein, partial [Candidatus Levyibacteriota bacterium]